MTQPYYLKTLGSHSSNEQLVWKVLILGLDENVEKWALTSTILVLTARVNLP